MFMSKPSSLDSVIGPGQFNHRFAVMTSEMSSGQLFKTLLVDPDLGCRLVLEKTKPLESAVSGVWKYCRLTFWN